MHTTSLALFCVRAISSETKLAWIGHVMQRDLGEKLIRRTHMFYNMEEKQLELAHRRFEAARCISR